VRIELPRCSPRAGEWRSIVLIADLIADSVQAERFWVLPHPEFNDLAVRRWHDIAEGVNPAQDRQVPGLPSMEELAAEIASSLAPPPS